MKKTIRVLVIVLSALLTVGFASTALACEFDVFKFNDLNGNGVWDAGEPAIEGWLIRIYRLEYAGGPFYLVASGTTNSIGRVVFSNLPGDSTYRVWEEQRDSWVPTAPAGLFPWEGGYYVQLYAESGSYHRIDFGNHTGNGGGEGCTPGYWRNHFEDWPPTGFTPGDDFDTVFGVDYFSPNITLGEAVNLGGGGVRKLARHGTAALLSAAHPDVDYPYSVAEVIAFVQAGDVDLLAEANELGCSIP